MTLRSELKQQSRDRILTSAARRMREEGLDGSGIAAVMSDAGLTHGAFYSHFKNKDEMLLAALENALDENRQRWISKPAKESWMQRLSRLAKRYLTAAHRNELANSCALATLSSEAARSDTEFKQSYEQELIKTLSAVCGDDFNSADAQKQEQALAFMSLIIGSMTLSRAVHSKELSDHLLEAGKNLAGRFADDLQNDTQRSPR